MILKMGHTSCAEYQLMSSTHIPVSTEQHVGAEDPSQNGEFDVLNSDCEDAETEICFVDDDEGIERSLRSNAEYNEDEGTCIETGESEDEIDQCYGMERKTKWRMERIGKTDMVAFANGEENMWEDGWNFDPENFPPSQRYPGLATDAGGPTDEIMSCADSPLKLFFSFMPKILWRTIADESNRYFLQNLTARVDRMFDSQRTPGKQTSGGYCIERPRNQIFKLMKYYTFRDHWGSTVKGAVPRGTFSDFMARNRFEHIMANLHFTNNADVRVTIDHSFCCPNATTHISAGYKTPPVISFDEGILPFKNRNNPTRQLKAKRHKWGTKLFLTCCATTAYCMRQVSTRVLRDSIEVYCGKAQQTNEVGNVPESQQSVDPNTGPAAVIRNLESVLPEQQGEVYHLVVTDRFYTSVQLSYQLLSRSIYSIGTIMRDKVGYPEEIVEKIVIGSNELLMEPYGLRLRRTAPT
ncbi:hypothetical protein PHMEG_00012798 [Phytophthora megakarya]|uniref:PiggyBac transposable element-derived protein domain-containing protein n=1 Tax=Phytophthora megakarya TaxID=4795 RepID=A0A225W9H7_9STRA|nr:hypothetical protein PHMEG_00012798 [Phytophthora megakarya]